VVCGLEQSDPWEGPFGDSVESGLHQAATNPAILHFGVHRDRPKPSNLRPLVEKVATHDRTTRFRDDAEEPRMREQHRHQIGRDIH
jgi:hypothetical protein